MSMKVNKNGNEYPLGFVPQSLYDDVEDLKDAVEDKVSKTGSTQSMDVNLVVNRANGTTSSTGSSAIQIGNNIPSGTEKNSRGYVELYGTGSYFARLRAGALTANRNIDFPDKAGTVALTSDIPSGGYQIINKYLTTPQNVGQSWTDYATGTINMDAGTYLIVTTSCGTPDGSGSPIFRTMVGSNSTPEYMHSATETESFTYFGIINIPTSGNVTVKMQANASNAASVTIPAYEGLQVFAIRIA